MVANLPRDVPHCGCGAWMLEENTVASSGSLACHAGESTLSPRYFAMKMPITNSTITIV